MTLFSFDLSPRFRYQDLTFLKTLLDATKLLYSPESSVHTKLVQLPVVHMMLTQHSLFLPTMLTSEEEENLLDSRVKGDPTLCPLTLCPPAPCQLSPSSVCSECSDGISVCQIQGPGLLSSQRHRSGRLWFMEVLWEVMWLCHELLLKVWGLGEVGRDGKTSVDVCPARTGLAL